MGGDEGRCGQRGDLPGSLRRPPGGGNAHSQCGAGRFDCDAEEHRQRAGGGTGQDADFRSGQPRPGGAVIAGRSALFRHSRLRGNDGFTVIVCRQTPSDHREPMRPIAPQLRDQCELPIQVRLHRLRAMRAPRHGKRRAGRAAGGSENGSGAAGGSRPAISARWPSRQFRNPAMGVRLGIDTVVRRIVEVLERRDAQRLHGLSQAGAGRQQRIAQARHQFGRRQASGHERQAGSAGAIADRHESVQPRGVFAGEVAVRDAVDGRDIGASLAHQCHAGGMAAGPRDAGKEPLAPGQRRHRAPRQSRRPAWRSTAPGRAAASRTDSRRSGSPACRAGARNRAGCRDGPAPPARPRRRAVRTAASRTPAAGGARRYTWAARRARSWWCRHMRVHRRVDGTEAVTAHQFAVAVHVKAAAARVIGDPPRAVDARQQVPWQRRQVVVHQVQIIIQKQHAEKPSGLVEHDALLVILGGPVFVVRADHGQRLRRIRDRQQVPGRRHAKAGGDPPQHGRHHGAVAQPHRHIAPVPAQGLAHGFDQRAADGQRGPHQQPAPERLVEPVDPPHRRAHARPFGRRHVLALGIERRHGQVKIDMVAQMAVPVQPVRIPDRQRRVAEQAVHPRPRRGMAVDQLMLERQVPGAPPDHQHRGQAVAEQPPVGQREQPARVDDRDQQPRPEVSSRPRSEARLDAQAHRAWPHHVLDVAGLDGDGVGRDVAHLGAVGEIGAEQAEFIRTGFVRDGGVHRVRRRNFRITALRLVEVGVGVAAIRIAGKQSDFVGAAGRDDVAGGGRGRDARRVRHAAALGDVLRGDAGDDRLRGHRVVVRGVEAQGGAPRELERRFQLHAFAADLAGVLRKVIGARQAVEDLHVLPVDQVCAGVEHEAAAQQGVFRAYLVIPQAVGRERGREARIAPARRGAARAHGGRAHRRRRRGVDQVAEQAREAQVEILGAAEQAQARRQIELVPHRVRPLGKQRGLARPDVLIAGEEVIGRKSQFVDLRVVAGEVARGGIAGIEAHRRFVLQRVARTALEECAGRPPERALPLGVDAELLRKILHRVADLVRGLHQRRLAGEYERGGRVLGGRGVARVAVQVRGGRDELRAVRIVVDAHVVQLQAVGAGLRHQRKRGVRRQTCIGVVDAALDVGCGDAGVHHQVARRLHAQRGAPLVGRCVVGGAARDHVADVAGVVAGVGSQAQRRHVLLERQVDHAAQVAVGAAEFGRIGYHRFGRPEQIGQIGLLRDLAHRAGHRARAEQGALRPLQHFDALEVQHLEVGIRGLEGDGHVVDVHGDQRRILYLGGNDAAHDQTAHGDVVHARALLLDRHGRHQVGNIGQIALAVAGQAVRFEHRDRCRHLLHVDRVGRAGGDQHRQETTSRRVCIASADDGRAARNGRCHGGRIDAGNALGQRVVQAGAAQAGSTPAGAAALFLQLAGRAGDAFAAHAQHVGNHFLGYFQFVRQRAVQAFKQPAAQALFDAAVTGAGHRLRQLGEQGAGVAHQLLRQGAAAKECVAQHGSAHAVAVTCGLHDSGAVGAFGFVHRHPHHAFAADHGDLGGAAVLGHILERDDGVGREEGVFHLVADVEQVLAGFERHQLQMFEHRHQLFAGQGAQQFILLGSGQADGGRSVRRDHATYVAFGGDGSLSSLEHGGPLSWLDQSQPLAGSELLGARVSHPASQADRGSARSGPQPLRGAQTPGNVSGPRCAMRRAGVHQPEPGARGGLLGAGVSRAAIKADPGGARGGTQYRRGAPPPGNVAPSRQADGAGFTNDQARTQAAVLAEVISAEHCAVADRYASKQDVAQERHPIKASLESVNLNIDTSIAALNAKIDASLETLNAKIDKTAAEVKGELIRWVVSVHVKRALHLVVVDGRVNQRRRRAVGLALDVFVAVHALADPALRQRQAVAVGIPRLRRQAFPLGRGADVVARAFRRDRAHHAGIGEEADVAGDQRAQRQPPRQSPILQIHPVRALHVIALAVQRSEVERLHRHVVVGGDRAGQRHGAADFLVAGHAQVHFLLRRQRRNHAVDLDVEVIDRCRQARRPRRLRQHDPGCRIARDLRAQARIAHAALLDCHRVALVLHHVVDHHLRRIQLAQVGRAHVFRGHGAQAPAVEARLPVGAQLPAFHVAGRAVLGVPVGQVQVGLAPGAGLEHRHVQFHVCFLNVVRALGVVEITGVPVIAHRGIEQRVGRILGGVGTVGKHAVAVRVAADGVMLAPVLGARGHRDRAGPRGERFAVEVETGHVLGLARVLLRAIVGRDVFPRRLVHGHVADDVEWPAAGSDRHGIAAHDAAVRRPHGVDGGRVARVERHVVDDDVGAVDAVLGIRVVRPFLAGQLKLAVAAHDHAFHFARGVNVDIFREHRVGRAVLEAGDVVSGARGRNRRRQVRVAALDGQVGVLGRAGIGRECRFHLAVIGSDIDFVVGTNVEADTGITHLARQVHGQVGAGAHAAAQIATHAKRVDAVGDRAGPRGHAVGAVIELVRLAVGTERRALQRAVGDQARTDLERRVLVPAAAVRTHFAEAGRFDALLAAIFRAGRHVQAVVHEGLAPRRLQRAVLVIVVPGHAAFEVGLESFEMLVGDEVDHAADGVRTVRGRRPARHHVHPLDQQLRELAHVRHAGDVGAHHALAVEQGQRADRAQAAQAQRAQALDAAAGAVGAGGAPGAALQRWQFCNGVEQVRFGGLGQVVGAQRRAVSGAAAGAASGAAAGAASGAVAAVTSGADTGADAGASGTVVCCTWACACARAIQLQALATATRKMVLWVIVVMLSPLCHVVFIVLSGPTSKVSANISIVKICRSDAGCEFHDKDSVTI
uniref:Uncharacterized protein n=1 Tax=Tanacetum cinerariifolium TaxID=118510 RepID=A0A699GHJ7_TANCI|nr:hypothetical protein [Tanacetum cinerariifolium]